MPGDAKPMTKAYIVHRIEEPTQMVLGLPVRIDWWRALGCALMTASAALVILAGWALVPYLVRP